MRELKYTDDITTYTDAELKRAERLCQNDVMNAAWTSPSGSLSKAQEAYRNICAEVKRRRRL